MALALAGLMCHAPIVHPEVSRGEAARCRGTTRAMREVAERVVRARPDRVVVISPHAPRHPDRFAAWTGRHVGDLGDFRTPQVAVDLPDAEEVAAALGLPLIRPRPGWLDHGAMVPLGFLWKAGWRGPTAILALPRSRNPDCESIGRALAELPGQTALIASGDMSHRLIPGAPAGFHPQAVDFDRSFVKALQEEAWAGLAETPHRVEAAEDVVDSTRVALGAAGQPLHAEVLHYEGPWGVGYTEAILYDPAPPLYAVARRAVHQVVRRAPWEPWLGGPAGKPVFVTLRHGGRLRGCIGRLQAATGDLWQEVSDQARAAATRDPRFPPIREGELAELGIEVSVLESPESIQGPDQLDPAVYGVVVQSGNRRGVLLPDIEGIDTVASQLFHVRRKAGIGPDEPVTMERFRVTKEVQP